MCACFLAVTTAAADPSRAIPDPPARRVDPPRVSDPHFTPSWDLDGLYFWLGPVGAAGRIEGMWDSTIGADAAIVRVRERDRIAVIGGALGASKWTERAGGRIWLDALIGTRLGKTFGLSAGPLLELAELAHPRIGASVGVWAFLGVTPYARIGTIDKLGGFVEVGVHIALPVLRHN